MMFKTFSRLLGDDARIFHRYAWMAVVLGLSPYSATAANASAITSPACRSDGSRHRTPHASIMS